MTFKEQYENKKPELIDSNKICIENRKLFKKVLEHKEKKLRRKNNLIALDESCYKTLYNYCIKFLKINQLFENKPLKNLNKKEIRKVMEDFQDGLILKKNGKPHNEIRSYFSKTFNSTLFELAGKKAIVKKIMQEEFFNLQDKISVRIIEEPDIRKIIQTAVRFDHKAFLQLYWDIGENVFSILQLEKRDCIRKINENTKEPEYYIILRKEIIKRSRLARTEITNHKETTEYLDMLLKDKNDNDKLFSFGIRQAEKIFDRAVTILNVKTNLGDKPKLKDIRSSMACYLLKIGWSSDEVNARLGHSVGSKELKKYVSYLAIDRTKPKQKVYQSNLIKLETDIEESKQREKIKDLRYEELKSENESIKKMLEDVIEQILILNQQKHSSSFQ